MPTIVRICRTWPFGKFGYSSVCSEAYAQPYGGNCPTRRLAFSSVSASGGITVSNSQADPISSLRVQRRSYPTCPGSSQDTFANNIENKITSMLTSHPGGLD